MKTLFVINSLEGGGAERALVRLVDAMASCSWFSEKEIHLVLLDKKPIEQEIPSEVVVHQLDSKGGFISSLKGLGRKVEEIKPEVMVSYLTRSNIASSLLSKFYSVPLIISERVNTSSHFIGGAAFLYKAMVKYLYPFANKIVAVSDGVKSDLVDNFGIDPEKVVVINNGYSKLELEKSASDSESIEMPKNSYAVAVGRLVPNKNMRLLIQAHAEGNYDFDLLILGDGPDRDELEAYARALNDLRNGQVYFKGFVRNPYPYIKGALFYVSSSNAEGFPNALVESMVLGKAVLSTNCPSGPAEILDCEGLDVKGLSLAKYGVLTPVGDCNSMKKGLSFLQNEANRSGYEESARLRAQKYSLEAVAGGYIELIEELVS